jgi:hypothetical protein
MTHLPFEVFAPLARTMSRRTPEHPATCAHQKATSDAKSQEGLRVGRDEIFHALGLSLASGRQMVASVPPPVRRVMWMMPLCRSMIEYVIEGEGIVDFVRHAGHELAERSHLRSNGEMNSRK